MTQLKYNYLDSGYDVSHKQNTLPVFNVCFSKPKKMLSFANPFIFVNTWNFLRVPFFKIEIMHVFFKKRSSVILCKIIEATIKNENQNNTSTIRFYLSIA